MPRFNFYETFYLTRPDLAEQDVSRLNERLKESLSNHKGEIMRFGKWDERDLAYRIADYTRGVYYIMVYRSQPSAAIEIEKNLRFFNTDVLRFMTLNISEEEALSEKGSSDNNSNNGEV